MALAAGLVTSCVSVRLNLFNCSDIDGYGYKKASLICGVSEASRLAIGFHSHHLGVNNENHDHDYFI